MNIAFNKPHFTGNEIKYILETFDLGKISGNGIFTKKCHDFFTEKYGFKKVLLTTSCTDALEMSALLADILPGDEVILPSYTFVSTANAFALRGARLVFADSSLENPNIDANLLESLITSKTKVIVVVHYAGIACDMDKIMSLAEKYSLLVIEDSAMAIDSYYKSQPLGSIGHLATFSFHESKNIISGEGGMLVINDERFIKRAEIIWEKGTNRAAFFRGEVAKYNWIDIGSSFLPSEITACFLYAQLENLTDIQKKRKEIWQNYCATLGDLESKGLARLPFIPNFATNNAHMFYLVFERIGDRDTIINRLKRNGIHTVFHYISLHSSPYYKSKHDGRILPNSDYYTDCLLRLPLYYDLTREEQSRIIDLLLSEL